MNGLSLLLLCTIFSTKKKAWAASATHKQETAKKNWDQGRGGEKKKPNKTKRHTLNKKARIALTQKTKDSRVFVKEGALPLCLSFSKLRFFYPQKKQLSIFSHFRPTNKQTEAPRLVLVHMNWSYCVLCTKTVIRKETFDLNSSSFLSAQSPILLFSQR